ncbi:MAG: sigma 54-interacting transcriptional regulator [Candidatus Krumholzibacteriia bacterium]
MAEFEGFDIDPGPRDHVGNRDLTAELERLEEVGDLHFHAAAFKTALDYYNRVLPAEQLASLPAERALAVLRKALTACLHLGWTDRADQLLARCHAELDRVDVTDPDLRETELARILVRQSVLLMQRGEYQPALDVAKRAFTVLALTDQHVEVANLQLTMGACHQSLGRLDKAEEFYLDSLSTYRRVDDEVGVATLYNALAMLKKAACRWEEALQLLEKAVDLATRHGAPQLLSGFLLNRGIVLVKANRLAEARLALEKSLELCRSLGDRIREPKVLLALGRLELLSGRLMRAEEHIVAGQHLADRERMKREAIIADEYLGDVLMARGDLAAAILNYELGLDKTRPLGRASDVEGELLRRRAEAHRRGGDLSRAVADAHAAVAVCEECGEVYELGFCHVTLGEAYAASEDWSQADAHFRQAVELFQSQNLLREWCDAVCAFLDARLASADKPMLLLLRRLLLDVQDQAAATVGDRPLARCLERLARVQLRLGLCDDALLTVFELERVARGLEDPQYLEGVSRLRRLVDAGLVGAVEADASPVQVLASIPGLFQPGDTSLNQHLDAVLAAVCQRSRARCGFFALRDGGGRLEVSARQSIHENLATQLSRWYANRPDGQTTARYFSRLGADSALVAKVPGLAGVVGGCLFMPVASPRRDLGVLFLGFDEAEVSSQALDGPTLQYLSGYLGFLALFLAEKAGDARLAAPAAGAEGFDNIITGDPGMHEMLDLLRKVASSDLTVLLRGATGTGKGMLAYALHRLSPRADRRFQSINCAAIPETLLESELFGHVRGSFTGADTDKKGLLLEAEGGTVFLDEIGKMPLSMQGKLLHFLDTKVVRPVGSNDERRVDVRIVCASKTDLQGLVQGDRFLEDLYFRLLDFPLVVPPLRERPGDIALLAAHFVHKYADPAAGPAPELSDDVLDALQQYDWPGNIRELEKCLQRALILARGEPRLRPEHLPRELTPYLALHGRGGVTPLRETLAAVESREIAQTLKACAGNKAASARALQISYPSLLKKIKLYGLDS